ncbi:hypothetical protein Tco_1092798 [Tanacetum coccineum]|uniref:Uncharacterized protein n=1 Tax=Tanacetum coccineum TaxID=301880 RepID=A0ABQ5IAX1_9ASTR
MAQQQHADDVHPDELCLPNKRYDLMDANKKVDFEQVQCPTESKILMNIIKDHLLRFSIAASSSSWNEDSRLDDLRRNKAHIALSDVCGGESSAPKRSTVIHFRIPQRRSTRLTPPAPVPTVDKEDEMILQDTLQVSLAEHKSQEDQEARENLELVNKHLASEEIEKMVDAPKNVIDDSPIPRNDDQNIPDTRLEPRSDKESPEVEITNVVILVNVNEEEEEITDEVYELKRREKGKIVEESRSTPSPTPIRSPRIHIDLGRYGYLFEHLKAKFLSRKSFDTLADHLKEVMVESLPTMVDKHIKEQVEKRVPEQVKIQVPVYVAKGLLLERQQNKEETDKMISKAMLQERGRLQAEISSQIQQAIDNHIPSLVDKSVRNYMSGHILHVHLAQPPTTSIPEQQYQLYLSMKNNPQLQQQDIAIWLALQMKFETLQVPQTTCRTMPFPKRLDQDDPHDDAPLEGENSAKWQKTSKYKTYMTEESSRHVNESEQSLSSSELKKIANEMLRQRCTSGDEHQYHIDQMKNFLKSDIKGNSRPEKIVLSLYKFPAIIFNDVDIEERTSRWVNSCVKKFNPYARYGVEHWKNPHAKIFYIKRQKEPGKPKEVVYSKSKIIQVIKTYWELGHEHKFITKIVARRANECIVSITESDYKNLNKNDIEDIYLLIMNGKVPDYAKIESYQQKVNLTAPTISFLGIEKHKMFSIIYEPVHGIIYKNSKKEKRVMRHSEIHKFCDATLNRVLEGLKSYNNDVKYGYIQRDLIEDEVEYLKLFVEEIEVRLKYRNQMRRWEIIINPQETQQVVAHDEKWVPSAERVKISSTNLRLETTVPPKEETFHVVIDIIKNSTCFKAFTIFVDKCRVDVKVFREILDICPRVEGKEFTKLQNDDDTLTFLIDLGYKESYQMFIKYSTGQILLKKSRGKGSQGKKTTDDSQETVDVSEESELEPELVKRKTASRRAVKKKVIISADDNIIPDPDVALELGKSISLAEAKEEEAAKQVHATYSRIVTVSVPEYSKKKTGSRSSKPKLKGVQSLTPAEKEAVDIMQALNESKKTSKRQPVVSATSSKGTSIKPPILNEEKVITEENVILKWGSEQKSEYLEEDQLDDEEKDDKEGDVDDEGDDHISATQDTDDETEFDEDEIYKYKIRVCKDEDEEMLNAKVEDSGKAAPVTTLHLPSVSTTPPAPQQATTPISLPPITTDAPIITSAVPESNVLSVVQLRVAKFEKDVSELNKIDHFAKALATLKSQVPTVVEQYLGSKIGDDLQKVLQRHTADLIQKYSMKPAPESSKIQILTEKSASKILNIKKEQAEKQKMPKYTIKSTEKADLKEYDKKSTLYQTMHENKSFNRNPANHRLYYALTEALIEDENAIDKGVVDTVKDHKQKHDEDDDDDDNDDDDEDPPARPDQSKKIKRRRNKESESSKKPSSTKETPKGKASSKGSKTGKSASTKEPVEELIAEEVMDDAGEDVVRDDDQPQDTSEPKTRKTPNQDWFKQPPRPPTPDTE